MIRPIRKTAFVTLLLLVAAAFANPSQSAVQQLQTLTSNLKKSRENKDWRANLASAKELKEFSNGSPDSLLDLSRAEIHARNLPAAMQQLQAFARMGQSTELLTTSKEFAPLRNQPGFTELQSAIQANHNPVSLASIAFPLPDPDLLAEDIDYDPHAKQFLVTSIREKKIVSTTNGTLHDFANSPDRWPVMAIKIDSARDLVWATEVALQGFIFAPQADWGRAAVLCYDLKTGKLLRRIEAPRGASLGDMALTPNGDVIVSDGDGGGVYRLSAKSDALERLDNGDFISPQTPAMHPDGKHIFVPDYVRGIALLDLTSKQVQWLPMDGKFALNGIDGLYFHSGQLLAVQNGTSPERVIEFTLNAALTKIESAKIIERSTPTLGDPTHGVIVDGDFYYIANSGWDILDDHGNTKPDTMPSAPRIMRVKK
jgi:hypothetical protein